MLESIGGVGDFSEPLVKSAAVQLGNWGPLPIIAIGARGGKIVGYNTAGQAIYAGSAASKKLAHQRKEMSSDAQEIIDWLVSIGIPAKISPVGNKHLLVTGTSAELITSHFGVKASGSPTPKTKAFRVKDLAQHVGKPLTPKTEEAKAHYQAKAASGELENNPFPDLSTLKWVKKDIGGSHNVGLLIDGDGKKWVWKWGAESINRAEEAASRIGRLLIGPNHVPAVKVVEWNGQSGALMEFREGEELSNNHSNPPTSKLNSFVPDVMHQHVYDWIISNHDSHAGNFLLSGKFVSIDKGQAWRFFGQDKLDADYQPNNSAQIYIPFWKRWKNGQFPDWSEQDLLNAVGETLDAADKITEEQFKSIVGPYASLSDHVTPESMWQRLVGARAAFEGHLSEVLGHSVSIPKGGKPSVDNFETMPEPEAGSPAKETDDPELFSETLVGYMSENPDHAIAAGEIAYSFSISGPKASALLTGMFKKGILERKKVMGVWRYTLAQKAAPAQEAKILATMAKNPATYVGPYNYAHLGLDSKAATKILDKLVKEKKLQKKKLYGKNGVYGYILPDAADIIEKETVAFVAQQAGISDPEDHIAVEGGKSAPVDESPEPGWPVTKGKSTVHNPGTAPPPGVDWPKGYPGPGFKLEKVYKGETYVVEFVAAAESNEFAALVMFPDGTLKPYPSPNAASDSMVLYAKGLPLDATSSEKKHKYKVSYPAGKAFDLKKFATELAQAHTVPHEELAEELDLELGETVSALESEIASKTSPQSEPTTVAPVESPPTGWKPDDAMVLTALSAVALNGYPTGTYLGWKQIDAEGEVSWVRMGKLTDGDWFVAEGLKTLEVKGSLAPQEVIAQHWNIEAGDPWAKEPENNFETMPESDPGDSLLGKLSAASGDWVSVSKDDAQVDLLQSLPEDSRVRWEATISAPGDTPTVYTYLKDFSGDWNIVDASEITGGWSSAEIVMGIGANAKSGTLEMSVPAPATEPAPIPTVEEDPPSVDAKEAGFKVPATAPKDHSGIFPPGSIKVVSKKFLDKVSGKKFKSEVTLTATDDGKWKVALEYEDDYPYLTKVFDSLSMASDHVWVKQKGYSSLEDYKKETGKKKIPSGGGWKFWGIDPKAVTVAEPPPTLPEFVLDQVSTEPLTEAQLNALPLGATLDFSLVVASQPGVVRHLLVEKVGENSWEVTYPNGHKKTLETKFPLLWMDSGFIQVAFDTNSAAAFKEAATEPVTAPEPVSWTSIAVHNKPTSIEMAHSSPTQIWTAVVDGNPIYLNRTNSGWVSWDGDDKKWYPTSFPEVVNFLDIADPSSWHLANDPNLTVGSDGQLSPPPASPHSTGPSPEPEQEPASVQVEEAPVGLEPTPWTEWTPKEVHPKDAPIGTLWEYDIGTGPVLMTKTQDDEVVVVYGGNTYKWTTSETMVTLDNIVGSTDIQALIPGQPVEPLIEVEVLPQPVVLKKLSTPKPAYGLKESVLKDAKIFTTTNVDSSLVVQALEPVEDKLKAMLVVPEDGVAPPAAKSPKWPAWAPPTGTLIKGEHEGQTYYMMMASPGHDLTGTQSPKSGYVMIFDSAGNKMSAKMKSVAGSFKKAAQKMGLPKSLPELHKIFGLKGVKFMPGETWDSLTKGTGPSAVPDADVLASPVLATAVGDGQVKSYLPLSYILKTKIPQHEIKADEEDLDKIIVSVPIEEASALKAVIDGTIGPTLVHSNTTHSHVVLPVDDFHGEYGIVANAAKFIGSPQVVTDDNFDTMPDDYPKYIKPNGTDSDVLRKYADQAPVGTFWAVPGTDSHCLKTGADEWTVRYPGGERNVSGKILSATLKKSPTWEQLVVVPPGMEPSDLKGSKVEPYTVTVKKSKAQIAKEELAKAVGSWTKSKPPVADKAALVALSHLQQGLKAAKAPTKVYARMDGDDLLLGGTDPEAFDSFMGSLGMGVLDRVDTPLGKFWKVPLAVLQKKWPNSTTMTGPDGKTYPAGTKFTNKQIHTDKEEVLTPLVTKLADHKEDTNLKVVKVLGTGAEQTEKLTKALSESGLESQGEFVVGGQYTMAFVKKADLKKVAQTVVVVTPEIPPQPSTFVASGLPGVGVQRDGELAHNNRGDLSNLDSIEMPNAGHWIRCGKYGVFDAMQLHVTKVRDGDGVEAYEVYGKAQGIGDLAGKTEGLDPNGTFPFPKKSWIAEDRIWEFTGSDGWPGYSSLSAYTGKTTAGSSITLSDASGGPDFNGYFRVSIPVSADVEAELAEAFQKMGFDPEKALAEPNDDDFSRYKKLEVARAVLGPGGRRLGGSDIQDDAKIDLIIKDANAQESLDKATIEVSAVGKQNVILDDMPTDKNLKFVYQGRGGYGESIPAIIGQKTGGMSSNRVKLSLGLGSEGAASFTSDLPKGGTNSCFTRLANTTVSSNWGYKCHGAKVIYHPRVLKRADWYAWNSDKFGSTVGAQNSGSNQRQEAVNFTSSDNECNFEHALSDKDIIGIVCPGGSYLSEVKDGFAKSGITELNGIPIEDLLFDYSGQSRNAVYKRFKSRLDAP